MLQQSPKETQLEDDLESIRDALETMRKEFIDKCKETLWKDDFQVFEKEINEALLPGVLESEIKEKKFDLDTKMNFIINKTVEWQAHVQSLEAEKELKNIVELNKLNKPNHLHKKSLGPFTMCKMFRSFEKYFDSEKVDRIPIVVTEKGFRFEKHYADTIDGYSLEIHRIFKDDTKGKKVVFLQHGLMDSSATWIMGSADESLGFVLAAQGFDVWLGNVRGNNYSRRHKAHELHDEKFWDFTWEDMASKDLPSMIDRVLEITNQSDLFYVGHSQGGLIGFVEFSKNQELRKKIKHFFALAPAVQLGDMDLFKNILSYLYIPFTGTMFDLMPEIIKTYYFGLINYTVKNLLGNNDFTLSDIEINAIKWFPGKELFLNWTVGSSDSNKSYTERIDFIKQFYPSGTSVKNLLHFVQLIKNAPKVKAFNYGYLGENKNKYNGKNEPNEYDVGTINMPLTVYYGENDGLVSPKGIELLQKSIKNKNNCKFELIKGFNHVDFVWSSKAKTEVYDKIIKTIKSL